MHATFLPFLPDYGLTDFIAGVIVDILQLALFITKTSAKAIQAFVPFFQDVEKQRLLPIILFS